MQNFVTVLERKDSTAISSFQKALLMAIQENTNNKKTTLASIDGDAVSLTEWSDDINGMITSILSFYGAITHINFTTTESYTVITPYVMDRKVHDLFVLFSDDTFPFMINLSEFKGKVLTNSKPLTLINLYTRSVNLSTNKEKYVELLGTISQMVRGCGTGLKGLVLVEVEKTSVNISFTTDVERFLATVFSKANSGDINFAETNPLSLVYTGNKPFTYYIFGLSEKSNYNFGTATSLTVEEFLELNDLRDIIPLTSNEDYTNITPNIVSLLSKFKEQTKTARISSRPLD